MLCNSETLLSWYDANARDMPWRTPPAQKMAGVKPDPYFVWLSEVMLQQTTVAAVKSYFLAFTDRWPKVQDLAAAQDADVMAAWAGLGYYARARNLLKCARVVAFELNGVFPSTQDQLMKLPGIGPYTSAAIASIAFDQPATVVDGNVERVMSRVHAVLTPLPASKPELTALAAKMTPALRPGDYAQAVMDLGATICTPKSPACGICPWMDGCQARAQGIQADLPKKTPKAPKPVRKGIAYVATNLAGDVLLETRPDKGLLGGMLGWPGTQWQVEDPTPAPPFDANWTLSPIQVRHTFTHFHLVLDVMIAKETQANPDRGHWVARSDFKSGDLPTVMRKVWDAASGG